MLPIDSTKRFSIEDEEGNVFKFRYLLGSMADEYNSIMNKMQSVLLDVKKYQKKMECMTEEEIENDPEIDEKTTLVQQELMNHRKALIDLFLAEVETKEGEAVSLSEKPSEDFPIGYIPSLSGLIQKNMNKLTGTVDEEIKNLSRPHTSPSTVNITVAETATENRNEGEDA